MILSFCATVFLFLTFDVSWIVGKRVSFKNIQKMEINWKGLFELSIVKSQPYSFPQYIMIIVGVIFIKVLVVRAHAVQPSLIYATHYVHGNEYT